MQTQLLSAQDSAARHRTCDSCGQAETIEHYPINCSQNEIASAVKNICDQRKISFTLPTILRQVAVLEELRRGA